MATTPTPIDPRGPRTNQAVLACALVAGFLTGQWWVVPVFAVVLFLGAAFGPKWGPVLRLYAVIIKPRLAPPTELEDPRPPRFAATVGVLFLGSSTIAFAFGQSFVGWTLALIVAVLAGVAAATGLCIGCEMYVMFVRLRGGVRVVSVERSLHDSSDVAERPHRRGEYPALPAELRSDRPVWVVFTTEFCAVCPQVVAQIAAARPEDSVVTIDVAEHLDLASAYKIRRAPTVVRAAADGSVLVRLAGADMVRAELDALRDETALAV
jgi:thiol-disulfide isomerase/thioredoxin